jgi:hypothetical protein
LLFQHIIGLIAIYGKLWREQGRKRIRISISPYPIIESLTVGRSIEHLSPTMVLSRIVNRSPKPKYPPMASGVREFLERLYAKENMGLGDLIGIDIKRYWPYMRHHG